MLHDLHVFEKKEFDKIFRFKKDEMSVQFMIFRNENLRVLYGSPCIVKQRNAGNRTEFWWKAFPKLKVRRPRTVWENYDGP
jgi:hypothetical protein